MTIELDDQPCLSVDDVEAFKVDLTAHLGSDSLSGSPTVALVTADTDVTIGTPANNTATYVDKDGDTVAIGKAVEFTFTSTSTGSHQLLITATTAARTIKRLLGVTVE
jgi:hypothetical protein